MRRFTFVCAIVLLFGANAEAAKHYTRSMFVSAIKRDSAAPRYALVQVRDLRTNSMQTLCVRGRAIVDAVEIEKGWTYRINGKGKAERYAARHWNQPFAFETANALARVQAHYSLIQLSSARARLSRFSNAELRSQLKMARRPPNSPGAKTELQRMYEGRNTPIGYASRGAIAHALLERGILVASDSRTGALRLP